MKRIAGITSSLAIGLLLSSCGTQSFGSKAAKSGNLASTNTAGDAGLPMAAPSPSASSSPGMPVFSPDPVVSKGVPPYDLRVAASGYTATTTTVSANKILKLKFTPGAQDTAVGGTGYYAQYSMLFVYITVGNKTEPTPVLTNGFANTPVQSSPIYDFSNSFTRTCAATDATCRQQITITIDHPNYDYWCLTQGMYCPWTRVYQGHPWNGKLQVQTDDTDPLSP